MMVMRKVMEVVSEFLRLRVERVLCDYIMGVGSGRCFPSEIDLLF